MWVSLQVWAHQQGGVMLTHDRSACCCCCCRLEPAYTAMYKFQNSKRRMGLFLVVSSLVDQDLRTVQVLGMSTQPWHPPASQGL